MVKYYCAAYKDGVRRTSQDCGRAHPTVVRALDHAKTLGGGPGWSYEIRVGGAVDRVVTFDEIRAALAD